MIPGGYAAFWGFYPSCYLSVPCIYCIYFQAYYRAAKAALGLHNLYDSMLNLAEGVQNCASQELDDLFALAREISMLLSCFIKLLVHVMLCMFGIAGKNLSPVFLIGEDFEVHLRNFREKEKAAVSEVFYEDLYIL